jgi:hypothetical protein
MLDTKKIIFAFGIMILGYFTPKIWEYLTILFGAGK